MHSMHVFCVTLLRRILQLHQQLRLDQPHRNILAELLRGLGVPEWRHEADLLLDAFGSIRCSRLRVAAVLLASQLVFRIGFQRVKSLAYSVEAKPYDD